MLRCFWTDSRSDPIFLGGAVTDEAFEPAHSPGGLEASGDEPQFLLLARLADRLAEAVRPLMAPPSSPLVAEVATRELAHPMPLQVQERRQRQLGPALHRLEVPEPVLAEPERRLEFLEHEFDLP